MDEENLSLKAQKNAAISQLASLDPERLGEMKSRLNQALALVTKRTSEVRKFEGKRHLKALKERKKMVWDLEELIQQCSCRIRVSYYMWGFESGEQLEKAARLLNLKPDFMAFRLLPHKFTL